MAVRRVDLARAGEDRPVSGTWRRQGYTLLPNTAGCYTRRGRRAHGAASRARCSASTLVKLEVLGDERRSSPTVEQTLEAAEDAGEGGLHGAAVHQRRSDHRASKLEDLGCAAVMPLAAPIGSGLGIRNPYNLEIILRQAKVPVIVDAGVGTARDAAVAMELGCDGVLMNTAIAGAKEPVLMARAMRQAVEAGRDAYLAGRIPKKLYATASSPLEGVIGSQRN